MYYLKTICFRTVLKKLEQNKVIFASSLALKLEVNMKFNGDESIDKCISGKFVLVDNKTN